MDTNALLSDIFGSGGGIWFMMGAALGVLHAVRFRNA